MHTLKYIPIHIEMVVMEQHAQINKKKRRLKKIQTKYEIRKKIIVFGAKEFSYAKHVKRRCIRFHNIFFCISAATNLFL